MTTYDSHADAELDATHPDVLAELVAAIDAQAADEREAERVAMAQAWEPEGEWPSEAEIAEYENHLRRVV